MNATIHDLLTRKPDGTLSGPMSPVLMAQEVAKAWDMPPFNLMARVRWEDEYAMQQLENGQEWTGYDCVVLGLVKSDLKKHALFMVLDMGSRTGMVCSKIKGRVKSTKFYREDMHDRGKEWRPKHLPTEDDLRRVMNQVSDQLETLAKF